MLSAAAVENDDCASITLPSEASGSSSANSRNKRKSRIGSVFRAFQFHLMIKTDLRNGTTAVEKEKLLTDHLSRASHMTDVGDVGSGPAWTGPDSEMRQDSSTASGSSRRLSLTPPETERGLGS
jgi:hypothetical protein